MSYLCHTYVTHMSQLVSGQHRQIIVLVCTCREHFMSHGAFVWFRKKFARRTGSYKCIFIIQHNVEIDQQVSYIFILVRIYKVVQ